MVYTNSSASLNQVQVDFGNGSGYQTINLNTTYPITYTSGGEKELKVKFVYAGGTTLYSHSKIWIDYIAPQGNYAARFNGFGATPEIIAGDAWQGISGAANVTIELAPGHTQLTKPLIVVEGFDPDGRFNYFSFINRDDPGGIEVDINPDPSILYSLNEAIEDEDYDLVFIDFLNATDFIQRNALVVEAVIDTVNTRKAAAGSTEKNVVMGMSMGGLVARYALRDMEIKSEIHDTKLYISHDAPHQGANIPLAYQALVRHLVGENISLPVFFSLFDVNIFDITDIAPDLEEGIALLQTPAAQQMLLYQLQGTGDNVSINNNTLHNSFITEYSNMGYPQQNGIRNIAIANGSECGIPVGFADNATLFDVNETIDLPYVISVFALGTINALSLNPLKVVSTFLSTNTDIKAKFNLKALPNQESKNIYKGKIFIKKKVLGFINIEEDLIDEENINSSSTMLPFDNVSGGIYDINELVTLPPNLNDYLLEGQFNFIPTFSSLDIGSGNQTIGAGDLNKTYSPLSPPSAPKNTPFDNFFTNDLANEQHIQFTLNNGNWLLEELRDNNAFYSCASIVCSETLDLTILGENEACESNPETYILDNLSPNITPSWSISPAGGFNLISNNDGSVTITPNGSFSGEATLTSTIYTDCNDIILNKNILIGKPSINIVRIYEYCQGKYHYINFEANTNDPDASINWSYFPISGANFYPNGNTLNVELPKFYQSNSFELFVTITNSCGSKGSFYDEPIKKCGTFTNQPPYSARISPNPASSEINILTTIVSEDESSKKSKDEINLNYEIYDVYGYKLYSKQHKGKSVNIGTENLKEGFYILMLSDGEEKVTKSFIIKH
ncbi:T9SS type A sorting domain-containing protein [Algibacter amylolyticus]|uniref:T9SS type A sorting domain-containing protein n=2 Tax=Algibacter amylolyticus TaxID=1608400 RepID=A0A5M7BEQ5_9FLAO|nr:T9SS type A sorting domain-containing protein [Algibacter amylolyticus]KAA5827839.1 T9SS type A sorting domain-containing protein [Algibacter amylolyticus]MBB5267068.1 hypothetical protein [Algibacter amylolyticus]TSJ82084.1 T9SS type A sorting domain-containing protein [Algibacter amylolyticus]